VQPLSPQTGTRLTQPCWHWGHTITCLLSGLTQNWPLLRLAAGGGELVFMLINHGPTLSRCREQLPSPNSSANTKSASAHTATIGRLRVTLDNGRIMDRQDFLRRWPRPARTPGCRCAGFSRQAGRAPFRRDAARERRSQGRGGSSRQSWLPSPYGEAPEAGMMPLLNKRSHLLRCSG
jgi:hypothetical protein